MKLNSGFLKGLLCGVILALVIVLCAVFLKLFVFSGNNGTINVDNNSALEKVDVIEQLIDQYYLKDSKDSELTEGIYKGLVDGLGDPYSVYYTEEEYNSLQESVSGTYCGIGVSISQDDEGTITIIKPFEDAPGFEAGIRAGDILYAVNDEAVEGQDLSTVVAKIKGEADTIVKITVIRDSKTMDFNVTRKDIDIPTVNYSMLSNKVGYIYISSFDTVTVQQFATALSDLTSQNMTGLVVDLRDNPGGSLTSVVDILDSLLPEGIVVYMEDKNGNREEQTSDAEHKITIPLSVIVNGNSASASEIFAGAVKDFGAGKIVGTTTFGKGVVQSILPLSDGSAVKLTISNWFTPNGTNINKIGVTPDYEVELPETATQDGVLSTQEDTQLQKAIEVLNN